MNPATSPHIADLLRKLPTGSGVYQYFDASGAIVYIGKAKNLKNRVRSYFQSGADHSPKTERMLKDVADLRWIETATEVEALALEANLVKEHQPRFNVLLRDDKHFLYFKITNEEFPKIIPVRAIAKDGAKYFGPKTDSLAVRETIKLLEKLFHAEVCGAHPETDHDVVIANRKRIHLPCPFFGMGMCPGPRLDEETRANYDVFIRQVTSFLSGHTRDVEDELTRRMQAAALDRNFEFAARLRDQLGMITSIGGRQLASTPDLASRDVIGVAIDGSRAYFAILEVRDGKLIEQKNVTVSVGEGDPGEVIAGFVEQYYLVTTTLPTEILLPEEIPDADELEAWLCDRAGRRVRLLFPERGAKAGLVSLAEKNAAAFAVQSKARFENASARTIGAAKELADALGIERELKRIECYDISHLGGTATTASMVVFERGEPMKAAYRHFNIRSLKSGEIDDYASMAEILRRRMSYLTPQLPEGVKIRRATKKDALRILELNAECDPPLTDVINTEWFVALCDEEVIGHIREWEHAEGFCELGWLWVANAYRHRGIGSALARHTLRATEKKKLYLTCKPDLASFYEELGFKPVQRELTFLPREAPYGVREVFVWNARTKEEDPSFAILPDLVILDGGKGQLSTVLSNVKFPKKTSVVGLAKQFEEIWRANVEVIEKPKKKVDVLPDGVKIRVAKKKEMAWLHDKMEEVMQCTVGWDRTIQFLVAVRDDRIVGSVREFVSETQQLHIIESVWVDESTRGHKLGHALIRELVRRSGAATFYLDSRRSKGLKEYYLALGCEEISGEVPDDLFDSDEELLYFTLAKAAAMGGQSSKPGPVKYSFDCVRLPETSNALHLVTRIRDEAHRFANELRKTVIGNQQFTSELDELDGVGDVTKQKLLSVFGSVAGVRAATEDTLAAVVGAAVAQKIYTQLR